MCPGLTKGRRITGDERGTLSDELRQQYEGGRSIRALAAETGRSYGFVHRVLPGVGCHPAWPWRSDPPLDAHPLPGPIRGWDVRGRRTPRERNGAT